MKQLDKAIEQHKEVLCLQSFYNAQNEFSNIRPEKTLKNKNIKSTVVYENTLLPH